MRIMRCCVLSAVCGMAAWAVDITPNDARIAYDGVLFPVYTNGQMVCSRFDAGTLASREKQFNNKNAQTSTGAVIRFTARATAIEALFTLLPGENRTSRFVVLRDGIAVSNIPAGTAVNTPIRIQIPVGAEASVYEIALPNWSNPAFGGLTIEGTLLENKTLERKTYIAIGDSISHGTGQYATPATYPFQIAKRFGWELFNLAVGGGQISPAVGAMLAGKRVDYVSILIGYNDWNGTNSIAQYESDYHKLIGHLRRANSNAAIFCITPTFTTSTESRNKAKGDVSIDDYRETVRRVVTACRDAGDANIHLIEGSQHTAAEDLSDAVHLNEAGARRFAEKLGEAFAGKVEQ